jgi:hypothetical protein
LTKDGSLTLIHGAAAGGVGQAQAHHLLLQPLGARDCGIDLRGGVLRGWQVKNWAGRECVFVQLLLFVLLLFL